MKKFLCFSGAGLSAESGIPTFRDATTGMWKEFDPMVLANYRTWRENFHKVHAFYNLRRQDLAEIKPNAAHFQIAEWQRRYNAHVYTQNIDLLLEKAGCTDVVHVHGRIDEMQCQKCAHIWNVGYTAYEVSAGCPQCQSVEDVKPNVVFFNEIAPHYPEFYALLNTMGEDGLFVCIGTSGTIVPVDDISQFLDCPTVINVLDLERDSDGYLPPIAPHHWTHCLLGPATERVADIDKVARAHFGF